MIKNIKCVFTAELPSNNRIEKLSVGDEVKLLTVQDETVIATVVFVRGEAVVGETPAGELVYFNRREILSIRPYGESKKLKPFILLQTDKGSGALVLHTRFPKLIAEIYLNDRVSSKTVKYIDLPLSEAQEHDTLKAIANWYYYLNQHK